VLKQSKIDDTYTVYLLWPDADDKSTVVVIIKSPSKKMNKLRVTGRSKSNYFFDTNDIERSLHVESWICNDKYSLTPLNRCNILPEAFAPG